jgi:hypothetical protein
VCGESNTARSFDLLSIIVESPGNYSLGAIFVRCGCIGRKLIGDGILEFLIISPILAAIHMLEQIQGDSDRLEMK